MYIKTKKTYNTKSKLPKKTRQTGVCTNKCLGTLPTLGEV